MYLARWLWWRVRASTELTAMAASVAATVALSRWDGASPAGPLAPDGVLSPEGRLLAVVAFSSACALVALLVTRAPDPRTLVDFYRRVRPVGAWGPVRALCPDVAPPRELGACLAGSAGGLALVYGLMLAPGFWLLERPLGLAASLATALGGAWLVARALARLAPRVVTPSGRSAAPPRS